MNTSKLLPLWHFLRCGRLFVLALFLVIGVQSISAQSMSDEQVKTYLLKQQKAGADPAKVIPELMKRGVTVEQIQRVRRKYEKEMQGGTMGKATTGNGDDRSRKNNGDPKVEKESTSQQVRPIKKNASEEQDGESNTYASMRREMSVFFPDSTEQTQQKGPRVFGRDIFNNKNLSFEPNMSLATPANYRLGPGDAVFIDIYGASQKTIQSSVSPDGFVTIEGFGPVQVSGLTVSEANARLRSQLGARYSSSNIKLTVGQTRTIMVQVMGNVKAPGSYTLSAFATVFHALYMAGGTDELGTLRNIKVYRGGRLVTTVDLYDYMLNGKLTGNVRLADNDVVMVDPYECLVAITGKVKRPMYYEMKSRESVGTLVRYAGGFTGDAYRKSVRLVRKTGREYSIHTVGEFEMNAMQLADADSVSVDSVLPRFENRIEVRGAVFRPGFYEVGGQINSVRELIRAAEGLREDAFTAHAVLHRMREDRTLEAVSVDVDGIMNGRVADVLLRKDDVLFIPTKQEMMTERTLTIHGEVFSPGVYKYAENTTLEQLVLQAGGLKDAASVVKVDVARRMSNPYAYTTDSLISQVFTFSLKDGFVIDGVQGFTLQPYDEVYVRRSPGFSEQQNVEVRGHVMFAGTYTLSKKNERLSDLIKHAGGVTNVAYVRGARLERRLTENERVRYENTLRLSRSQMGAKDSIDNRKLEISDIYYVGINLEEALRNPGSDADVILREGDVVVVPEYNSTVRVSGDVMMPSTIPYTEGKNMKWYIKNAGGYSPNAKKSKAYIVYMNGTARKLKRNTEIRPGSEIIIPAKPPRTGMNLAQWLSIGTSVATVATMIVTIANIVK